MARETGATKGLKAHNQMAWVRLMNNCKDSIEEMIMADLIYT